jgi:hypothetical protein
MVVLNYYILRIPKRSADMNGNTVDYPRSGTGTRGMALSTLLMSVYHLGPSMSSASPHAASGSYFVSLPMLHFALGALHIRRPRLYDLQLTSGFTTTLVDGSTLSIPILPQTRGLVRVGRLCGFAGCSRPASTSGLP